MSRRRSVLITGANAGIGYEAFKALLESNRSYCIILGCRSLEKARGALERLGKEVPSTHIVIEAVQVDIAFDVNVSGTHVMTHVFARRCSSTDEREVFRGRPDAAGRRLAEGRSARLRRHGVPLQQDSPQHDDAQLVLVTNLGNSADLLKQRGAGDPSIGERFIRDVVKGQRDADVGKVVYNDWIVQPY
ncbi:NAD(P)-binding protein [Apiospora rasikravindrae]|uniref:NAD(P)-binding protein n=1 Tax=Apiospora rasikravindrae TaxID=990691 RepID=A0ABR1T295_9PEZI